MPLESEPGFQAGPIGFGRVGRFCLLPDIVSDNWTRRGSSTDRRPRCWHRMPRMNSSTSSSVACLAAVDIFGDPAGKRVSSKDVEKKM